MSNTFGRQAVTYDSGFPVWKGIPERVVGVGKLLNPIVAGENFPVGSPCSLEAANGVKILPIWKVKATSVVDTNTVITVYRADGLYEIKAGQIVMVMPSTITGTGKAFAVTTVDNSVAGESTFTVATASLDAPSSATIGKYTLSLSTNPTADDKITINGVDYVFAAAAAADKIAIGASATATCSNLEDIVEAKNADFNVVANGATLVFTQKVAGIGAIPTMSVTQTGGGTIAASIATTTAGVAPATGIQVNGHLALSASATAQSGQALYCQPTHLTYSQILIGTGDTIATASPVYKGYVFEKRIPYLPAIVKANIRLNTDIYFDNVI